MSQIDKLAIRGIRSFDNQSMAVIQFYSPLTVIVGHNGSGKTTIIECLKYITTGDLPPNTKGGAFVHDPSIAGEAVVMAEVLLRFKNLAGTKLIASRRLQVTKKKNTALTMKTLEGTLSYNDDSSVPNAKRRTISTKCAEMDSEVPRHLGVSKAILENVIFCHQEDSNWPLSEPASLKKKFDEIFEATKYTKALDNIKSIKKDAAVELKVDKEKYNALVTDKNRADKLQSSIDKISNSIKTKEAEYQQLETKIRDLTEENKKFYEGALRFKEILNEHSTLNDQKSNKLKIIKDLLEDIEEITDATDSQLVERREQSKNSLSSHAGRLSNAKSQLAEAEEDLSKLRSKHQNKFTVLGQLKAQAQRKVAALEERQEIITSIISTHKISEFEHQPIPDTRVVEFYNLLRDQQRRAVTELEKIKKAGKRAEEEKQTEIFKLKSDEGSAQQRKQTVADRVDETRSKIRNLGRQIEGVNVSEADIKIHSDDLEAKRQNLASLKQEIDKADYDLNIASKQSDIEKFDAEREKLHVELVGLNRQSDTRAKLGLKRTDVVKKEEGIKTLIQIHGPRFQELVEKDMTPQAAEQDINHAIHMTERKLTDASAKNAAVTKEMQTIETKLQLSQSKLTTTRKEVERLEKKINGVTSGQTVSEGIKEAEEQIEERHRDLHVMQFSVTFHENLLRKAKDKNKCGACQRMFHGDDEMSVFERYCIKTIEALPENKKSLEGELKDWQDQLTRMKNLVPLEVSLNKLRDTDLPALQEEVKDLESKMSVSSDKVQQAHSEVEKLKDRLSELTLCKRPATDISRMKAEIEDLTREIKELETDLESSGTTRTADQVQEELDDMNLQLVESKREMQTFVKEREKKRNVINNVQNQVHQSELSLGVKQLQMRQRESFQAQKEELKKEIAELEEKTKNIEDLLKTFGAPIRSKEVELEQIRTENAVRESEQAAELQAYNTSLNRIQAINKEIQKYDEMEIETNCQRCQMEIDRLDQSIKSHSQQISDLQESLLELDNEAAKAKAFERNISDNIRLRTYRREIRDLDEKIKELDIDAATKSNDEYDKEYHKARKYLTECQAEQAKIGGEIGIDKKVLKDKKNELDLEFKDIIARHRAQLVKVKTVELANQDLDKYAKALDSAIMKYHSHKMAEINDTIQTLWQKTYQGTDIDNISIKSENENVKSNRSYNYRVVMMKDQVEMDMRGRCSAGQKVLASIIIRLALAESFGTNCGILALDEPTTNLDKDNIDALAGSLAEIIKERKDQANFQLVVITHDEDFLNQLGQADVLDKYWRVSRNLQQKSIIERQRLV